MEERITLLPAFCHEPVLTWECPKGPINSFGPWFVPCKQRAVRWLGQGGIVHALCRDHAPRRPSPAGR